MIQGEQRQETPLLLFVRCVYQHQRGDLRRISLTVEPHRQPAEGVADKHEGAGNRGAIEQEMQVADKVFNRPRLRRGVATAKSRAVIGDDPCEARHQPCDVIVEIARRPKPHLQDDRWLT